MNPPVDALTNRSAFLCRLQNLGLSRECVWCLSLQKNRGESSFRVNFL
ncbi:hypothetical protein HMPREF0297_1702 [Corynebacterium jeikeium ATCC 43734]|nr:hypothetical protein HMPREF0297_1702 [Corynebacterium jeikeium ATCC 43734]